MLTDSTSPVTETTKDVSVSPPAKRSALHGVSLRSCKNTFISDFQPKRHAVSRDTRSNVAFAASKVKGTCGVVQRYHNAYRIYSTESQVYQCDFFRLMYFPPEHFLSMFRKSKPAVNVRTVGQVFLNGNVLNTNGNDKSTMRSVFAENSRKGGYTKIEDVHNKLNSLFQSNPSNIPKNYAFLRRQLRLALRKCFIKEWCRLQGGKAVQEEILSQSLGANEFIAKCLDDKGRTMPGIAKDGFYSYQVLIFPDSLTGKEFEANVKKSVQIVANLEWDKFLRPYKPLKGNGTKTWVQIANDRVNTQSLNKLLKSSEVPFALMKT